MAERVASSGPIKALERHGTGDSMIGSAEVMMMLLADARLPTGAHTQSAGLEPALRGGMSPGDVPRYITARLRTVTAVEAGAAVVARARTVEALTPTPAAPNIPAHRAAPASGAVPEPAITGSAAAASARSGAGPALVAALARELAAVDAAWRARTVSPELRETSVLLARGYARLVRRLWPDSPATQALLVVDRPGRAVVLGVTAALAGLSAAQLVRLIGYDDAQTVSAATLKLEPLDPAVTTGWVMATAPDIDRLVDDLAPIDSLEQIPASSAPLIERWAQVHATTSQRLFRA